MNEFVRGILSGVFLSTLPHVEKELAEELAQLSDHGVNVSITFDGEKLWDYIGGLIEKDNSTSLSALS